MKAIIRVWRNDIPHEVCSGMPMETLVDSDDFGEFTIVGLGITIERCRYDTWNKALIVYLDKMPARIDVDTCYKILHILSADRVSHYPNAYTCLEKDEGKGIILWTDPNVEVEAK